MITMQLEHIYNSQHLPKERLALFFIFQPKTAARKSIRTAVSYTDMNHCIDINQIKSITYKVLRDFADYPKFGRFQLWFLNVCDNRLKSDLK